MIPPRRVLISGGGIKVISIVGALSALEKAGTLVKVKEYCGVSAGAFLAFLLASGLPIHSISTLITELNFGIIRNMSPEAFLGFPELFGIDDGANLVRFLESIIRVALKLNPELTFEEFAEKQTFRFRCWATDLNSRSAREFSLEATPSVRIVDALHASMCLPLYFIPVVDPITGHMLSDGGIQGNLPLHHLTDDECQECIAIGFSKDSRTSAPQDFMGFMNSVLECLVHERNETVMRKWYYKILRIPIDNYPSWNFEASREDKEMLFSKGIYAAESWLKTGSTCSRKISRRHSFS